MNLINCIEQENLRITTIISNWPKGRNFIFSRPGLKIFRFVDIYKAANGTIPSIYYNLLFIIKSFLYLIWSNPEKVFAYETLSLIPIYFYKKFNPKASIFIHYHEYTSMQEIINGPVSIKISHFFEKKLVKKADWISHTNQDRINLFIQDFPYLSRNIFHTLPNYPPSSWIPAARFAKSNAIARSPFLKFVYVGSLSCKTMYTMEFATWIIKQNGRCTWTIFSDNIEHMCQEKIKNLDTPYIKFKGSINYFDLPNELPRYDIGIVHYNGSIPNFIYNVPNKVFEYLACGIDIWFSSDLISTGTFKAENTLSRMKMVNFKDLNNINSDHDISQPFQVSDNKTFSAETSYKPILDLIYN